METDPLITEVVRKSDVQIEKFVCDTRAKSFFVSEPHKNMITTIAAGIMMIPPAIMLVGALPVIALLSIPGLSLLCYKRPLQVSKNVKSPSSTRRKRAVITGGSSGIGLCVAEECVKEGFDEVVLIARNLEKLNKAKEQLKSLLLAKESDQRTCRIEAYSVDVAKESELKAAADKIFCNDKAKEDSTFTCLFCVAGTTYPEYFSKIPSEKFAHILQTNQLGSIFTVKAFLPKMTTGTIQFTSSMAGQVGTFGYTAYSPTKFALRGFAEALHMELVRRPISVCVAYPPDTDTPGFEQESLTKPAETKLISEEGGLAKPHDIARTMVSEACKINPRFSIYFSFDGWMLSALTAGFSPVTSSFEAVPQVAGMCLFRVISLFYLKQWTDMIRSHSEEDSKDADETKTSDK